MQNWPTPACMPRLIHPSVMENCAPVKSIFWGKRMAATRDKMIHDYFGLDYDIDWDIIENKIPDLNSGYRIFKKEIAEKYVNLLPNGFSCVTTMTLSFIINNHQVNYLNIKYKERMGTSKFNIFSDTFKYIRQIAYLTTLFNPLKIYFSLLIKWF
jgi:hypothetical protein